MSYTPIPYPRMLYKGDDFVIVNSEQAEDEARAEGWGDWGTHCDEAADLPRAEPVTEPLGTAAPVVMRKKPGRKPKVI